MNRIDAFTLLCDCISPCNNSHGHIEVLRKRLLSAGTVWEPLVQAANKHLLCPALYGALKHKNLLSSIPADLREYLQTLHDYNGERNRRLLDHAEETTLCLNELGVEPVLLKGTANLLSGLYLDQGMRFISDIDMLVPEDRMHDCIHKLREAGYAYLYSPESDSWKDHHHCPPLLKTNRYFGIELHRKLIPRRHQILLDADRVLSDSTSLTIGTGRARIPSLSHRIIHNTAHAQLTDRNYCFGEIQLRQLYDLVLLADNMREEDWQNIQSLFRRFGYSRALAGYFLAGKTLLNYFPRFEIQQTFASRLYLASLYVQANHQSLMRLGNTVRLAMIYSIRLKRLLAYHKFPKILNREIRQNHYRQIRYILSRNW
jgi:hypothetical protein